MELSRVALVSLLDIEVVPEMLASLFEDCAGETEAGKIDMSDCRTSRLNCVVVIFAVFFAGPVGYYCC